MRKALITVAVFVAVAAPPLHAADFLHLFNTETIYWENDNFGVGRKSDRFYTNGVKVTEGLNDTPAWATAWRIKFCKTGVCGKDQAIESVNVMLGQNFYTPQIITDPNPQPFDRPWAGWLYTGVAESIIDESQKHLHLFELQVGILGPGAGAAATQTYIHRDLGFSKHIPAGWHNQLKNEPGLNLLYQYSPRFGNDTRDVTGEFGGMLGTVQTYFNGGVTGRIGWHISGFPVAIIKGSAVPAKRPHFLEAYVFGGVATRWVPWNATLEGGLFRNGPKAVGPQHVVTDVRIGASGRIGWLRLTYTVVDRGKEFEVPPGAIAKQRFGSFALTIEPFTDFR